MISASGRNQPLPSAYAIRTLARIDKSFAYGSAKSFPASIHDCEPTRAGDLSCSEKGPASLQGRHQANADRLGLRDARYG